MSRVDRIVARRQESSRPQRNSQKHYVMASDGKTPAPPRHHQGNPWWRSRYADMVERRDTEARTNGHSVVTYEPRRKPLVAPTIAVPPVKPKMLPRPEGMTRQAHRRLYRQACKMAGVSWASAARRKD